MAHYRLEFECFGCTWFSPRVDITYCLQYCRSVYLFIYIYIFFLIHTYLFFGVWGDVIILPTEERQIHIGTKDRIWHFAIRKGGRLRMRRNRLAVRYFHKKLHAHLCRCISCWKQVDFHGNCSFTGVELIFDPGVHKQSGIYVFIFIYIHIFSFIYIYISWYSCIFVYIFTYLYLHI